MKQKHVPHIGISQNSVTLFEVKHQGPEALLSGFRQ